MRGGLLVGQRIEIPNRMRLTIERQNGKRSQ